MPIFGIFPGPPKEIFQAAADRTILTPIPHLKGYVPHFFREHVETGETFKIWDSTLSRPNRPLLTHNVVHRWKAMDLSFLMVFLKIYIFSSWKASEFWGHIWTEV